MLVLGHVKNVISSTYTRPRGADAAAPIILVTFCVYSFIIQIGIDEFGESYIRSTVFVHLFCRSFLSIRLLQRLVRSLRLRYEIFCV